MIKKKKERGRNIPLVRVCSPEKYQIHQPVTHVEGMLANSQLMAVCGMPQKYFWKCTLASTFATIEVAQTFQSYASCIYLSIKQTSGCPSVHPSLACCRPRKPDPEACCSHAAVVGSVESQSHAVQLLAALGRPCYCSCVVYNTSLVAGRQEACQSFVCVCVRACTRLCVCMRAWESVSVCLHMCSTPIPPFCCK